MSTPDHTNPGIDRITLSGVETLAESDEPHETLDLLGKGAMGEVFRARDLNLQRTIAVKRLHPRMADEPSLLRRFLNEVQITAQLEHPGIPPVHRLSRDENGVPSYTMKLVRGIELQTFIEDTRKLEADDDLDEAHDLHARLEMFLKVCDAVAYAHSRGVLHRDLKPENIMVGAFRQVLVMDWGIARVMGGEEILTGVASAEGEPDDPRLTRVGETVGTPAYMSPEQASGVTDDLTPASDQYAMGLILYELATLKRARHRAMITLALLMGGEPEEVGGPGGLDELPRELAGIVAKATHIDPAKRYSDVDALADDVRRFLRDEAVLAAPDSIVQRAGRFIARNRLGVLTAALALLVVFFLGIGFILVSTAAALEAQRLAAHWREQRIAELDVSVDSQAAAMSEELHKTRELLQGIASAAELAIAEPAPPIRWYAATDLDQAETAPPDWASSEVFGFEISPTTPDVFVSPDVDLAQVEPTIFQIVPVASTLRRAILHSHSHEAQGLSAAQQHQLIARDGVPLVWAYVGMENGVMVSMPGSGSLDDPTYDHRDQPWYNVVRNGRGIHCDSDGVDESGLGVLLTCVAPLYTPEDEFAGIAAVDLTIAYLVDAFLEPPDLGAPVEAFLIDSKGRVQVRSSLKDEAKHATEWSPKPFEHAAVLGKPKGHAIVGDQLVMWASLGGAPWKYVVVGEEAALLAGH